MCGLCAQTMQHCRCLPRQRRRLMETRWTGDRDPYRHRVRACDEESASLSFVFWLQQMSRWSWAHWDWGINSTPITTARFFICSTRSAIHVIDRLRRVPAPDALESLTTTHSDSSLTLSGPSDPYFSGTLPRYGCHARYSCCLKRCLHFATSCKVV